MATEVTKTTRSSARRVVAFGTCRAMEKTDVLNFQGIPRRPHFLPERVPAEDTALGLMLGINRDAAT